MRASGCPAMPRRIRRSAVVWLAFDSGLPVGRIGAGGCRIEVRARAIEDGCTATGRRAGVERGADRRRQDWRLW